MPTASAKATFDYCMQAVELFSRCGERLPFATISGIREPKGLAKAGSLVALLVARRIIGQAIGTSDSYLSRGQ